MTSTSPDDRWLRGDPYERYIGRWSRLVAPAFLDWLALPAGLRWLDVGCGTGALAAAIVERASPTAVAGVEPSEGFLAKAVERLAGRASMHHGSAEAIPLGDRAVDATVSALMLNFAPDPLAAVAEMRRVTVRGGTIAAYVWDYAAGMQIIRAFWDAAVELDAGAAALDEAARFPLCHPEALAALLTRAGLREVSGAPLDVRTPFESFDDFWEPFLGGQGPAPAYVASLGDGARNRLRETLRGRLPDEANGAFTLTARAWAVRGRVPA